MAPPRRTGPLVEPVSGEPAAVADVGGERALVVADYHAGIEAGLRYERGVELDSDADVRRARIESLLDRTDPDRLVILGDLGHRIGGPKGDEEGELAAFAAAVTDRVPVTLVRGNHDGGVEERLAPEYGDRFAVTDGAGVRLGDVGFVHGHRWPKREVIEADVVCSAHEHPAVRLEDSVGGGRKERAWLRGPLRPEPFAAHLELDVSELDWRSPELVVFPAFNNRSGGTWVNVEGQGFLSPFLPDALLSADAYLLDGTRLGAYDSL
ncbi:metallophosphoesterase [Halopelagius fulvigenes]|uniref:Metallophosphoesterase n=1 Tax=Halopelagius fulvigenes TaxID=1198324 RepID=A0ABD5U4W6_9EURY